MVDLVGWLSRLCLPHLPSPSAAWHRRPFSINLQGRPRTVATNARILVALAGHLPGVEAGSEEAATRIGRVWPAAPVWGETIPLRLLREWSGPANYIKECDCTRGCERCDYEQNLYPALRPGYILDVPVDWQLLACGLEHLKGGVVRLTLPEGQPPALPMFLEPVALSPSDQPPGAL
jgi:hypothetical protein